MTNQRLVAAAFAIGALIAGRFLDLLLEAVFARAGLGALNRPFLAEGWTYGSLVAYAAAAGLGVWAWTDARVREGALEIAAELRKVTWPSWKETRAATVAVIVATFVSAAMLGAFDAFWQFLSNEVVPRPR